MQKKHVRKLNSYNRVKRVFSENAFVLDVNAGLKAKHTEFGSRLTAISNSYVPERKSTIPITESKDLLLEAVSIRVDVKANALLLLAFDQNDPALAVDIPRNFTELTEGAEVIQLLRFKKVHEAAKKSAAALAIYGITADLLTELDNLLPELEGAVGAPRSGIDQRMLKREQMEALFDAMDVFLDEQLDRAVRTLQLTNKDVVDAYFQARKLYTPPGQDDELPEEEMVPLAETTENRMVDLPTSEELAAVLTEVPVNGTESMNGAH